MQKSELRIVFLGTPEFAVGSLSALIAGNFNVVGVITAPDRTGGRGMKQIIESDVKKYALLKGIPILQPKNLKNTEFIAELKSLKANLQIVVAFRMLPEIVWNMPTLGTYNLHGSLLPKYRGAAPINWAIINGEPFTGLTTFKLKHEIDTGNIALQERITIEPADYLDVVHDKMMTAGGQLIVKTVEAIISGQLVLKEQDESGVSKAPKIYHKDCQLDPGINPQNMFNKIRGLSPYPVGWVMFNSKKLKIYKARYSYHTHEIEGGKFISDGHSFLIMACEKGILFIDELQLEGKRRMKVKPFLNGAQITKNKILGLIQSESPWSY